MAVRHQLVEAPSDRVWAVLADPGLYGRWVVGPTGSRPVDGDWPDEGARLEYTVRLGPFSGSGVTTVRSADPGRLLELEADSGRLGTARIAIELRPWGANTLVIVDEHPLRGPGGALHSAPLDALLHVRNRRMLRRLADLVEERPRTGGHTGGPAARRHAARAAGNGP
ncbi:SRPBCC family protein [Streptomyces sp. NPDC086023]|uniref:SRPBCC family protein n=1 Tax=Streptomyces sp. NPDC086023 TaxID=3365746 RepID=UPI0037D30E85